jgi:hypothetical protein
MFDWSLNEEKNNAIYKLANGKLSNFGKKTTAFSHYLDFCDSLGLISNLNGFYANKRLSYLLLHLLKEKEHPETLLSTSVKLFYLSQLFILDSDGILLAMDMIAGHKLNQKQIQENFKSSFSDRLLAKQDNTTSSIVKSEIGERFRTLNFQWQNAETYAEHILIPRFEWLHQLGIVNIQKEKGATYYSLTTQGANFHNNIPEFRNADYCFRDIDDVWIKNQMFSSFGILYTERSIMPKQQHEMTNELLGHLLVKASSVIKSSNAFRLPLYDTILFLCIELFVEQNIIVNFEDILIKLRVPFSYGDKEYFSKEAGRINEGYINTMFV